VVTWVVIPARVQLTAEAVDTVTQFHTTCAVTTNHSAFCWWNNGNRQIGAGLDPDDQPVGSVPRLVAALNGNVHMISVGYYHSCAVTLADAALWCWGTNR
jgi:alpha-tubulin suppressor-like RCC1 family protein